MNSRKTISKLCFLAQKRNKGNLHFAGFARMRMLPLECNCYNHSISPKSSREGLTDGDHSAQSCREGSVTSVGGQRGITGSFLTHARRSSQKKPLSFLLIPRMGLCCSVSDNPNRLFCCHECLHVPIAIRNRTHKPPW